MVADPADANEIPDGAQASSISVARSIFRPKNFTCSLAIATPAAANQGWRASLARKGTPIESPAIARLPSGI
jgi:hypothetical protein